MTDFGVRRRVLPQTGQTISYRPGDDGYYEKGWAEAARFKDVGDGTIVDNATGLMWPDDANSPGGNNGATLRWNNAIDYAEALNWKGYTDWRLPNAREFRSLFDYGPRFLTVNVIIQNAQLNNYWTSTTTGFASTNAWLWFRSAMYYWPAPKTYQTWLLCCRDA